MEGGRKQRGGRKGGVMEGRRRGLKEGRERRWEGVCRAEGRENGWRNHGG